MTTSTTSGSDRAAWAATWGQALPDGRTESQTFTDVTLRSTLRVGIGGEQVRLEFSNEYGDQPLVIGHTAVTTNGLAVFAQFDGADGVTIPVGGSASTDAIDLVVPDHAILHVDFHLPEATAFPPLYGSSSEFTCDLAECGDHVGVTEFPAVTAPPFPMPDDAQISVHESGPFLRSVDVASATPRAVVVCLGDSITAMGWPEVAASLLPADSCISIVNRGIPGNRLRLDAGTANLPNGRAGLNRFRADVLGTSGVAHVIVALGTNDLGLPGEFEPLGELPTAAELIAAYEAILDNAFAAGIGASIATIGPRQGSDNHDDEREQIRIAVNDWIRGLGAICIDFDESLRDPASPLALESRYDSGDHLHPSDAGQAQLGRTAITALQQTHL
jgi:lysophospholipase L1-like esterase